MHTFLKYFQLIVSVLLIFSILLQNKTSGFSAGSMTSNAAFQSTKRGAEKVIFNATIIFAALFVASSLAFLFVS
ncbi:preprotein translocase subunit SecG [Candidatus Peregrinibacteria bacterium]|nr:preprotein translocase subunit SecG [Candidatus Peregrinibacteria bacterium]